MDYTLNMDELKKLSEIGGNDGENGVAPTSIFSTIALTFTVCTATSIATSIEITLISVGITNIIF